MIDDRDSLAAPHRDEDSPPSSRSRWPSALHWVIALNVAVCLLQLGLGWQVYIDSQGSALPMGGVSLQGLSHGAVWTLVTALFVHVSPLHLLVNLLFIAYFGRTVLSLLGTGGFLKVYFCAGIVGAAVQMILKSLVLQDSSTPVLGASACACGLMVAASMMLPEEHLSEWIYSILPLRVTQQRLVAVLALCTLVLGLTALFSTHAAELWGGNAYFAHLGGMAVGWYMVRLLGYGEQPMTYHKLIRERRSGRAEPARRPVARLSYQVRLEALRPEMDESAILLQQRSRMKPSAPAVEDVDDILDKISTEGISSLSADEQRRLDSASRELALRKNAKP
jgi:membrane associated rhomboid family serine protease